MENRLISAIEENGFEERLNDVEKKKKKKKKKEEMLRLKLMISHMDSEK